VKSRKWILGLILVLSLATVSFGQGDPDYVKAYRFTAAGVSNDSVADVSSLGIGFWKVVTQNKGKTNPSACSVLFQISPVNVSASYTTLITTSCVTTNGAQSLVSAGPAAWIRVNMTSLTLATPDQEVTVTVMGWREVSAATITNATYTNVIPATPGGGVTSTIYSNTALAATVSAVSASPGKLDGFHVFNGHSAVCFLQFFDLATGSVTLGTTPPNFAIGVPTLKDVNMFNFLPLKAFATAISVAFTTTATGSTACTTAGNFTGFYH
jgi:hypothetical protein